MGLPDGGLPGNMGLLGGCRVEGAHDAGIGYVIDELT